MPASRVYTVTQTRQVEVHANDPVGAARIAELAFAGEDVRTSDVAQRTLGVWGFVAEPQRIIETHAKEKTYK